MADQTIRLLDERLRAQLSAVVDPEGRIPGALASLGPVDGRRVLVIDPDDGLRARQLEALGGLVTGVEPGALASVATSSMDVVVACWSTIRPGEEPAAMEVGHAVRVLYPDGRLLVLHDYARDDVSALLGPPTRAEQLIAWSHRTGPFLANGFKLRVLHCWWCWETLEDASAFLARAFGAAGEAVATGMRRPRLSYKVAVYHHDRGGRAVGPGAAA